MNKIDPTISTISGSDTLPSALSWIDGREGTSTSYKPTEPNYLYIGENPDYIYHPKYTHYVHFYWAAGLPVDSIDNYVMQIQWRWEGDASDYWIYANTPSSNYGLYDILGDGVLEDISAYAFPYQVLGRSIQIRMRTINRAIFGSPAESDIHSPYLYDLSLVSEWSGTARSTMGWTYYNHWGYGAPQPEPDMDGSWPDDTDGGSGEGPTLNVYFPVEDDLSFSYECINYSGEYQQSISSRTPNFMGVSKSKLSNIGSSGGSAEIYATCRNLVTNDITYSTRHVSYGSGEMSVNIFFSLNEFIN